MAGALRLHDRLLSRANYVWLAWNILTATKLVVEVKQISPVLINININVSYTGVSKFILNLKYR